MAFFSFLEPGFVTVECAPVFASSQPLAVGKSTELVVIGKVMLNYLIKIMSAMLVMNRHQVRPPLPT